MVIFSTSFFRKLFWSKSASIYVKKIVNLLIKSKSDTQAEIVDDDLRGTSTLFIERVGRYDGMSDLFRVPYSGSTIDYWVSEYPDFNLVKNWTYFNHKHELYNLGVGYVLDMSYFDRHFKVYGDPCIVSGGPGLKLPWRGDYIPSEVTSADQVDDCYELADDADFKVSTTDFSQVIVIYPKSFAKTDIVTKDVIGFDGVNDYIDCGNQAGLWSQSLTKFSFSFWIYPTAGWDNATRRLVGHGAATAQGFNCYIDNATPGKIHFEIRNAANSPIESASTALVLNQWNFITCVYDNSLGSANVKIYVNSVLGGTTGNLTQTINQSVTLLLSDTPTDFKGTMKDFRWWTTKPLSQSEVNNLYANPEVAVTDPDYWLKFMESSGTVTNDFMGGLTATLTNGAFWDFDPTYPHTILQNQRYIAKRDDTNNGYTIWVETDGVLYFQIKKGGSDFQVKTSSAMSLNTWYWIVITWTAGTNTAKIYRNGTDITTSTSTRIEYNWQVLNLNLWLLSNNKKRGLANAAIYLYGFVRSAVSSTLVSNLFNNKSSFSDTTAAQQAWVDYCIPQ